MYSLCCIKCKNNKLAHLFEKKKPHIKPYIVPTKHLMTSKSVMPLVKFGAFTVLTIFFYLNLVTAPAFSPVKTFRWYIWCYYELKAIV